MFTVFGFYKFKKINLLKKNKRSLEREILKNNIRGTIILSPEGINGTIAGNKENIIRIIRILKKGFKIRDFDSKNTTKCDFQPFHIGKIKIKKEVVPLGLKINTENKRLALGLKQLEEVQNTILKLLFSVPNGTKSNMIVDYMSIDKSLCLYHIDQLAENSYVNSLNDETFVITDKGRKQVVEVIGL